MIQNNKLLITGGTGLIGKHLSNTLRAKGYNIAILSRSTSGDPNAYFWDVEKDFIEQKAIVKQVNSLMALCDSLEEHIENSQTQIEQLMQSCLREVFAK